MYSSNFKNCPQKHNLDFCPPIELFPFFRIYEIIRFSSTLNLFFALFLIDSIIPPTVKYRKYAIKQSPVLFQFQKLHSIDDFCLPLLDTTLSIPSKVITSIRIISGPVSLLYPIYFFPSPGVIDTRGLHLEISKIHGDWLSRSRDVDAS